MTSDERRTVADILRQAATEKWPNSSIAALAAGVRQSRAAHVVADDAPTERFLHVPPDAPKVQVQKQR